VVENQGNNPRTKNMIKFKIQLDLPSVLPDLEYKFQIIFAKEIQVNVPDTGS
jgi:hypothetical protein